MADESVIVTKTGTVFLGGPPLVKAATGEEVSAEDLGGARVHCEDSGVTDFFADNDAHALEVVRGIMEHVGEGEGDDLGNAREHDEPLFPASDLVALAPSSIDDHADMVQIIARLVDGSRFQQFKARYGGAIITGYGKIGGVTVGVIAAGHAGMTPTPDFVKRRMQLCEHRDRPIVFLQHANFDEIADSDEILKPAAQLGRRSSSV